MIIGDTNIKKKQLVFLVQKRAEPQQHHHSTETQLKRRRRRRNSSADVRPSLRLGPLNHFLFLQSTTDHSLTLGSVVDVDLFGLQGVKGHDAVIFC